MTETPGGPESDAAISSNGASAAAVRHCAFCGRAVVDSAPPQRFGEVFCSEAHADEFAAGVRTARVAAAAAVADGAGPAPGAATEAAAAEPPAAEAAATEAAAGEPAPAKAAGWKSALKMAACCGIPLLALVVLAGGAGTLLGAAGAVLPLLAVLACPLGMFFMMRAMTKGDHGDKREPRDRER